MTEHPKYLNPPLAEAVFEYFFISKEWSPVVPGVFYNEIKDKFPVITQNQAGFGISFNQKGLQIGGKGNDFIQYKNEKNDTIIQLANGILTINKLPKYLGWNSYLEVIIFAIDTLNKILKIEIVSRIGFRTLNKIDIKTPTIESIKKYYNIYPVVPLGDNKDINGFVFNLEIPLIKDVEIMSISLSTLVKEQQFELPTMLQLYITKIKDVDKDKIREWIDKTHDLIFETFEKSLTKYCKDGFNDVK